MASSYSSLLRLEKMANGELNDTWGTQLNNVLEMIEDSISGKASVTHDDSATYTLTTANGTVDEARMMVIEVGGALGAARNVVCPTSAKLYIVKNATTGGFAFTFKTSAGTGISVENGVTMILRCDGTNVVNVLGTMATQDVETLPSAAGKSLFYNSAWLLDQVNEGALYTVAGGAGAVQLMDGWSGQAVGAGTFKVRRLIDPDDASLMCAEVSCTTADAALAATDNYIIWTAVEGNDVRDLKCGQADAKQVKLSFKVKSNAVTGDFGVFFRNSAGDRYYPTTFTISGTDEQDASVAEVTLDVTGTWLKTTGIGLQMGICLAAGSNFQGTADAWTASAHETTASQANFMSANTNILYIKRIKLEQGSVATPWHPNDMDYAKVLAKGRFYYEKSYAQGTVVGANDATGMVVFTAFSTALAAGIPAFKTYKRAVPTVALFAQVGTAGKVNEFTAGTEVGTSVTAPEVSSEGFRYISDSGSGFTSGKGYQFHYTANARLS